MKARVGFLMFLLLTSMLIQANDTIPQVIPEGRWEVVQVIVEKNTDGTVEKNEYATAAEVKSHIPCPQVWYVMHAPQCFLLCYDNGSDKVFRYDIEDNLLMIYKEDGTAQSYRYEVNDEDFILTTTYEQPEKEEESNIEHWTITLKKQE